MNLKKRITDVRFWIVLFFIVRLIGITNPPLETGHNWRQTTVTMVSRNFLEVDNNIFYPRIDFAGEKTGITGMEFPLLNYLIYLVAEGFGYQHWYGRLINLIISSIGLWFFYKLLLKFFKEPTAFYATIILAVSIWFQYARKIMPDTFAMSFLIACIYYGTNYLENKENKRRIVQLIAYSGLLILGVLAKIPSGYLLVVFVFFIFKKEIPASRKVVFIIASILCMIPVVIWYFYWVPHLVETYEFWHFFMGKSFTEGFQEILQSTGATLNKFYETPLKFTGFAMFLYGLFVAFKTKDRKVYSLFVLTFFTFCVIVFKAGFTFSHHDYYIIPFVPVMALIAGYGLSAIPKRKIALIALLAISIEGIVNQHPDFIIKEKAAKLLQLEQDLDKVSDQKDLVLINSQINPTPMYFAHRKGWISFNERIADSGFVNKLKNKGLKYIVILKRHFGSDIHLSAYKNVLENEDYCIYAVN